MYSIKKCNITVYKYVCICYTNDKNMKIKAACKLYLSKITAYYHLQ